MIDLRTNKESELSFRLNIEGTLDEAPRARLIIKLNNQSAIAIDGEVLNDKVKVTIPPLQNSLREDTIGNQAECFLEIMLGEYYFVPWENTFNFKRPVSVTAEAAEYNDLKESKEDTKVSITVDDIVEKDSPEKLEEKEEETTEVKEEGKEEEKAEEEKIEENAETPHEDAVETEYNEVEDSQEVVEEEHSSQSVDVDEEKQEESEESEEQQTPQRKKNNNVAENLANDFVKGSFSAKEYIDQLFER
jgi:flagellar biosynthesis GTPase FlhF